MPTEDYWGGGYWGSGYWAIGYWALVGTLPGLGGDSSLFYYGRKPKPSENELLTILRDLLRKIRNELA